MMGGNDKATAIAVAFPDVVFELGYLSARLAVTYAFGIASISRRIRVMFIFRRWISLHAFCLRLNLSQFA